MKKKICTKCGQLKNLSEYHSDATKPDRHRPDCKRCLKERGIKYGIQNRAKIRVYGRRYRKNNPDKMREYLTQYRTKYPERRKQSAIKYATKNRQKIREYQRFYNQTEAGIHSRKIRKYRRRIREINAKTKGDHTLKEWKMLMALNGYKCNICNKRYQPRDLTRDHIIPISRGGHNLITNIQPTCKPCNCRKGAKLEVLH